MQHLPAAIDVAAVSDTGRVRRNNEDSVWMGGSFIRTGVRSARFELAARSGLLLAVADGVGGAAAGEVASQRVVEMMADRVAADEFPDAADELMDRLKQYAGAVNRELVAEARRRPDREGMATTYTAVLLGATGVWMNAGDSRLYALRGDQLVQMSKDHTLREESGDPSIPGNIITNCFGTAEGFYADTGEIDADNADAFLLCSDGLSDYADMGRVADVLRAVIGRHEQDRGDVPPDDAAVYLEHAARAALQLALEGGGGDNVSLLIARPIYE